MMVQGNPSKPADTAPNRLTVSPSVFLSLVNKTPIYLNYFAWDKKLKLIPFRQRTPASDLEVLLRTWLLQQQLMSVEF